MKPVAAAVALTASAVAQSRLAAPAGCLTVSQTDGAAFGTIQSAVDALPPDEPDAQCIFVEPGTFAEQVLVPERQAQLSVYGATPDARRYDANAVTLTASHAAAEGLSNDEAATLRVHATNFRLYNVDVANAYGEGSQAPALSAGVASGYYACRFTGFQDTLLANSGDQLYAGCLVQGATDFIFGQTAPAWFEGCDIRVVTADSGYITADGRDSPDNPSHYVFNNCDVAAAANATVADGAYFLGRPWREYARVTFQRTAMSAVIRPAGWSVWSADDNHTAHVQFGEFDNRGDGAVGPRASFATMLSAPVLISDIMAADPAAAGYYDAAFMP